MSSPQLDEAAKAESRRAPRYREGAVQEARKTWSTWAAGVGLPAGMQESATAAAVGYLQLGLPADAVAALVLMRLQRGTVSEHAAIQRERTHIERVLEDLAVLAETNVMSSDAAAGVEAEYRRRLGALAEVHTPLAVAGAPAPAAPVPVAAPAVMAPVAPIPPPASLAGPSFSLREVFAEHSVLILASLGAFLLVVATVLFELYGTIGLGGGVRLGAVVALAVLFAVAGFFARRRKGLESVGHIYIALAAVLLPLVGLAAWTFLDLGANGLTVYQALAVTAAACAVAYGMLAQRLELRAYGAMAGLAIFVTVLGASGWIAGDYWLSAGVALTPAVYALWQRVLRSAAFRDFQWFAHASAVIALVNAARYAPDGWIWTVALAVVAAAYLAWNAIAPQSLRAWLGEGAAIAAATAAAIPLGLTTYQFALPFAVAVPVLILLREGGRLGRAAESFRPHVAHLHASVVAGLGLAIAQSAILGHLWPLASGLAIAFAIYAADYALQPTVLTGATLRAALVLALAAGGRAADFGPWTASLTAAGLVAFAAPFVNARLTSLRRFASYFYYGGLLVVAGELYDASIGTGQWAAPAALGISAFALGAGAELGALRFGALAARGVFSLAWFSAVDALGTAAWRGPFDAMLAPFYVALSQVGSLVRRSTATAGRRWLVHAAAFVAIALCVTGPTDQVWWRLAAAGASLTVAYWWSAIVRTEQEMPWAAWLTVSGTLASVAVAVLPYSWQGAAIVGVAVVLTGAWLLVRGRLSRERLEEPAVLVLVLVVGIGAGVATFQDWPQWSQTAAALLAAAAFFAWSRIATAPLRRGWAPVERCVASAFLMGGLAIAAAAAQLDIALFGLGALAAASLHAEWHVRTTQRIERWYAVGVVLVAAPAIYAWPYANQVPEVVAIEFAAVAVLVARTATRSREWWLAGAAVLVLAPALHFALSAAGVGDRHLQEAAFASLAWACGLAGTVIRTRSGSRWALSTETGALAVAAGALTVMLGYYDYSALGIALLAYSALVYAVALQERSREMMPFGPASALTGVMVLLYTRDADTIYYAAALGVVGLLIWLLGLGVVRWIGRHALVDMHRYVGLGLLGAAGIAGFAFPDRTGEGSLGAVLATAAFAITGAVLYFDARVYGWRPNLHIAIVAASIGAFFAARFLNLQSWELAGPGLGVITAGITLRRERAFTVDVWWRRLIVAIGISLVMAWAAVLTVTGDVWWLVVLLVEGALAVGAGIVVRSRVLLGAGGAALALASLRALLLIAQAGYLFVAFGAVALALLLIATGLALGRERYVSRTRGMRNQLASWD